MQEDLLFDGEGELHETSQLLLEMKETLFHALLRSGVVGKVRAQLRASALGLLRGDGDLQNISTGPTFAAAEEPLTSQISLLLVMDFLQQHHLTHTAGVLAEEGSAAFVESAAKRRLADTMELFPGNGSMLERILQPLLETERTEMMRTDQQQQQQQPTSSTAKVVLHPTEVPTLEELTISRDGERSSILGSTTAVEDDNPGEDDGYQHHLPPPPPPDNIAAKLRLCEESLSFVDSVGEVSTRDGDVMEEMR